jgi:cardiolipin synthase
MIACGVRLFRYKGRFMHHKVVLVDEELAAVGTVNLDYRSLYLNFEETAVVADTQFARRVEAMLEYDLSHCDEVSSGYLENEPLHIRVQARVARLASPLL